MLIKWWLFCLMYWSFLKDFLPNETYYVENIKFYFGYKHKIHESTNFKFLTKPWKLIHMKKSTFIVFGIVKQDKYPKYNMSSNLICHLKTLAFNIHLFIFPLLTCWIISCFSLHVLLISFWSISKHGRYRQFLFLVGPTGERHRLSPLNL